ncbi:ribonuclease Z [Ranunculus cassubicifolius]
MPQISTLKLFFSTTNPRFSFKQSLSPSFLTNPSTKTLHKPYSVLTPISSRRFPKVPPPLKRRHSSSTFRDPKIGKKDMAEEATSSDAGFNKRRAEGRDKNDKPKNLQLKARKLNPVNTIAYVQVLGTGMDTQDTSPSVLLFFDKQRFIFNAGEGLQRYCTEHKIKLSKIDHIFLSRVCSETAGGLPGLLLTLAGMGDDGMSVNVWGSSDLKYLVDAMRSFIPNAAMVHTHSFGSTTNADGPNLFNGEKFTEPIVLIDDEVVKLSAILVRPRCNVLTNGQSSPITSSVGSDEEKDQLSAPISPHSRDPSKIDRRALKPGDISVVYICELPEIKGKFDPAKAKALGLKPGPKYRDLQLGISVMSDKQNVMINPSDVLDPSIPGPIVLLVDCPTVPHLQELLSIQSLSCYYADSVDPQSENVKSVNCIIHLSPSSVTMTNTYQNWMKRFGGAQHIMAGHEIKNIEIPILKASARLSARLNYLCPQFFPAPGFWSLQQLGNSPDSSEGSVSKVCDSVYAENLLKFHLRPYAQLGLDRSGIPSLSSSKFIVNELVNEIPEIIDSVKQISQLWHGSPETKRVNKSRAQPSIVITEEPWMNGNSASVPNINLPGEKSEVDTPCLGIDEFDDGYSIPTCLENIKREDMEFVLLGTGSSQPSKYRNVTSIYVNLFSKGSILLDCGEGSLGQLKRRYGVKGADDAVRNLRCIWISHIHADHHTGLARILSLRRELLRGVSHEPLLVIGPRQLKRFLDAYQRLEDLDMQFLDCSHTTEVSWAAFESALESSETDGSYEKADEGLFAKGSRMQSYWKRPSSPVDSSASFELLKKLKNVLEESGLEGLISVPVVHCPHAYGIVVKAAERSNNVGKTIPGWKLVYSGDTRPCPKLIDASQGATILIHEATFEDGMVDEAVARNHSTTKEAIQVGNSAGAYRIILTHFSQRYPKIPVFDETHMHNTCIGFDLMSVNIADLPVLPQVLPHFKLLFKDEMVVDEVDDFLGALL